MRFNFFPLGAGFHKQTHEESLHFGLGELVSFEVTVRFRKVQLGAGFNLKHPCCSAFPPPNANFVIFLGSTLMRIQITLIILFCCCALFDTLNFERGFRRI